MNKSSPIQINIHAITNREINGISPTVTLSPKGISKFSEAGNSMPNKSGIVPVASSFIPNEIEIPKYRLPRRAATKNR